MEGPAGNLRGALRGGGGGSELRFTIDRKTTIPSPWSLSAFKSVIVTTLLDTLQYTCISDDESKKSRRGKLLFFGKRCEKQNCITQLSCT